MSFGLNRLDRLCLGAGSRCRRKARQQNNQRRYQAAFRGHELSSAGETMKDDERGRSGTRERCVAVRLNSQFSRLLAGIISLPSIKHKGIGTRISEKARFVAVSSGFDLNKFYICQMV
jgi:hypothetical protein